MLQVRIHHDDGDAARDLESGRERNLMTKIARQRVDPHAPVRARDGVQPLQCRVGAAVVDEADEPVAAFHRIERPRELRIKGLDDGRLVVAGHDDREIHQILLAWEAAGGTTWNR